MRTLSQAEKTGTVTISDGTKGGRSRTFSIVSTEQIKSLKQAASIQVDDRRLILTAQTYYMVSIRLMLSKEEPPLFRHDIHFLLMPIKYHIRLSSEEQHNLKQIVQADKIARHKRTHAQILLALDENGPALSEASAADVCAVSIPTVQRVRKRCVEEGLEITVESKFSRHGRNRSLDGEQHARLIALTCSKPPEGKVRWTLKLLADKLVELEVVDTVSAPTICRELKKTK